MSEELNEAVDKIRDGLRELAQGADLEVMGLGITCRRMEEGYALVSLDMIMHTEAAKMFMSATDDM